tara:strand:- start:427 stop:879 length:453 start_codon:yes stop_codon:yes gene_type:complete
MRRVIERVFMAKLFPVALAIAALAATTPALADPCPKDVLATLPARIEDGGTTVAYRTTPAKIAVGKPFSIEVVACVHGAKRMAPSRIRVDAGMPMHGHGMNYTPSERKIGPGHSAFDGLVFHMPGRWLITFDIYDGDKRQRLTQKVSVRR